MKLVATKSFSYNTRRLNPGDIFEAKDPDGRLLIGVLKARKVEDRTENKISEPPKKVIEKLNSGGIINPRKVSLIGESTNEQFIPKDKFEDLKSNFNEGTTNVEISISSDKNSETEKETNKEKETPVKRRPGRFRNRKN